MPSAVVRARERGFTLVEVIIAVLLATAVVSSVALAVAGAGRLVGASKVSANMARASASVFERLESNPGWLQACPLAAGSTSANCTLYAGGGGPVDLGGVAEDDDLDVTWNMSVTGTAVDDPADGLRSDPKGDRDGRVPDHVMVKVELSAPAEHAARLGNPRPIEQTRTFDGKGRMATGSLIVEVCDVLNQVDDRMSVETCSTAGSGSRMADCPPGRCSVFDLVKHNPPSKDVANGSVMVQRYTHPISIRISNGSEVVSGTHLGDGSYVFKNVAAGSWRMLYPATLPNGHPVWAGHVRPSEGSVAVQPDTTSRGLVTYHPGTRGRIQAEFTRRVGMITWKNAQRVQEDFEGDFVWREAPYGCGYPPDAPCPIATKRYQTYYQEDNRAVMKVIQPHRRDEIWGGASHSITLWTRPEAYGRAVDIAASPPVERMAAKKVRARRGSNARHVEQLHGLVSGLHARLQRSGGGGMQLRSDPSRVASSPIWVHPDTGAVNGADPATVLYEGRGECYVAFEGTSFYKGETTYDSNSYDDWGPSNEFVDVEGFGGWRDDSCSMSKLRWKGKVYDCRRVCAYEFCWTKKTQYKSKSGERATATDPWGPDVWRTSANWNVDQKCWGYDPPLACQDWGATVCGPAPEIVHIPARPLACSGCGTTPKKRTRFRAVDLGS